MFGVILIVIGIIVVIVPFIVLPTTMVTSAVGEFGGMSPYIVNNTSTVLMIYVSTPINIKISAEGAAFKVALIPLSSLPMDIRERIAIPPQGIGVLATVQLNISDVKELLAQFTGNYTELTTTVKSNETLLVWPYKLYTNQAILNYSYSSKMTYGITTSYLPMITLLIQPLLLGGALIYGGTILYRWSKK
ncbi:MAG: hypothetical protein ACP5L5_11365 [Vulcanisaeta sp.]|uniref:hypothetical protein n=1 Tax=Vulcanisaeta sp. TaxID=2020871 RepID=UPI003D0E7DC5